MHERQMLEARHDWSPASSGPAQHTHTPATAGLDARAAAIVMRTVRNTVDTGRTVVCTIHQPSIDIFESFDELLLLKRGGRVIYFGDLGVLSKIPDDGGDVAKRRPSPVGLQGACTLQLLQIHVLF